CAIDRDEDIPLAEYGRSHIGRMKTIYRNGLGLRYGRMMQAISGVHFNYSFPRPLWEAWAEVRGSRAHDAQFISSCYFDLLRNYHRHGWLVLYLFGVSPVVCKSFLRGREVQLQDFGPGTAYEPCATSLRMSDVGYRNRNQAGLSVSVNSLEEYVRDLQRAISTPHPPYEALGVKVNGEYRQLNAHVLQIENEYYSFIRPKRVAVAGRGRAPGVALWRDGQTMPMRRWARELLDSMVGICEILDRGEAARPYSQALADQVAKVEDVTLTPSARLMADLTAGEPFFDLALRMSATHKSYFLDLYPPNDERLREFAREAEESLAAQQAIEASDRGTFEEYLAR